MPIRVTTVEKCDATIADTSNAVDKKLNLERMQRLQLLILNY